MERLILPHDLTTRNGCVVDLESEIGSLKLIEGVKRSASVSTITASRLPEMTIYEHIDFGGANARTNLNWYYVGDWWNDRISSIVIASGVWQFFQHSHYQGASWVLGPGYYRWVEAANIPNDIISSFQCIQLTD
jgi:Beta/Gamma crystallin